jgi:hypothetical protein
MSDTLKNPNPLPAASRVPPAAETDDDAVGGGGGEAAPASRRQGRSWPRLLIGVFAVVAILGVGVGTWWSLQPAKFDPMTNARAMLGEGAPLVPGAVTVAAAIGVAETLLSKPGGYLRNDVTPPGALMDNMPNWEYGLLTELQDSVRALRNDFSRSQTQSVESEALKRADSDFNFDSEAWILPSAEEQYRDGIDQLRTYLSGLVSGKDRTARFYARADNLAAYLAVVEKRLGSYGQQLSASVGDAELTAAFSAESAGSGPQAQALEPTSWSEIDNVFFEARGYTWALLHMLKALSVDFEKVLDDKNAKVSMQQIIRDLEHATRRKVSPLVLNGQGFGVLANHSLVLASYMARANAAVLDLRQLLRQG